jgi:hypothetical protein
MTDDEAAALAIERAAAGPAGAASAEERIVIVIDLLPLEVLALELGQGAPEVGPDVA